MTDFGGLFFWTARIAKGAFMGLRIPVEAIDCVGAAAAFIYRFASINRLPAGVVTGIMPRSPQAGHTG